MHRRIAPPYCPTWSPAGKKRTSRSSSIVRGLFSAITSKSRGRSTSNAELPAEGGEGSPKTPKTPKLKVAVTSGRRTLA